MIGEKDIKQDCGSDKVSADRTAKNPWSAYFRVLLSPVNGLKRLKSSAISPEVMASRVFYPILALVAAASFMDIPYKLDTDVSSILQSAVALFVSFFISYFAIFPIGGAVLGVKASEKISSAYGKLLVLVTLSSLATMYLLFELCPVLEPVLFFAPIYTIYIICRGAKMLRLEDKMLTPTILVISLLEIGLPYLIYWVFKALLQINS